MSWIAHRREDGEEQSLLAHLNGTARLSGQFAKAFNSEDAGYLAGMFHDIGKYSDHFQKRIRDPDHVPPHDHATAGAKEVGMNPLGFAIAGHHGGLPDGGSRRDTPAESTLSGRLKKNVDDYSAWKQELELTQPQFPTYLQRADSLTWAFYTRMLYSCLVDADFLDTESFMAESISRGNYETVEVLLKRLDAYFANWEKSDTKLNQIRNEILGHCIRGASKEQGLYTLTVPTGGGKTLASLRFALGHAVEHGLERIIYVIPYTAIIDQTAQVFQSILGDSQVIEHHSGISYTDDKWDSMDNHKHLATENWDAPIIVTTAVQFFESLYSNRSSQCRKLHNIAKSVVIFDEAQTLPIPYLSPCIAAISQLVKQYHTTAVLCTATQPELDDMFQQEGLSTMEIIPDAALIYQQLQRVTLQNRGAPLWSELGQELASIQQVLCIVNRRKYAQRLFECLPEEGSYCLTTLICPNHRKKQLAEIRNRLIQGLPCRVISTSLIEAGVDLDFPIVYREKAGLDSLLQAAGRCNREGKYAKEDSIVWYFESEEGAPAMLKQGISALDATALHHGDLTAPEAIADYFHFLWYIKNEEAFDVKQILPAFQKGIHGSCFPFCHVAQSFQLIESAVSTVYVPIDEGAELIQRLRYGIPHRNLYRKLNQYGVSVYPDHLKRLQQAGSVEILASGDVVLRDLMVYHSKTGLALDIETGIGYFM
ncbi:CRISPR-associated helicase Cas3' [Bengtsoniella intestinalis]|uniref:CRISPR-associated helicase Cas3' n=1 Tax=Bengtsoniella intestinalis TaxID=3073143 RepID=UPI00391F225E